MSFNSFERLNCDFSKTVNRRDDLSSRGLIGNKEES
jgi:hypothetical protein